MKIATPREILHDALLGIAAGAVSRTTHPHDDDWYMDELRQEDRRTRMHRNALTAHPDCRDPDHPGCHLCADNEDADDANTNE